MKKEDKEEVKGEDKEEVKEEVKEERSWEVVRLLNRLWNGSSTQGVESETKRAT